MAIDSDSIQTATVDYLRGESFEFVAQAKIGSYVRQRQVWVPMVEGDRRASVVLDCGAGRVHVSVTGVASKPSQAFTAELKTISSEFARIVSTHTTRDQIRRRQPLAVVVRKK